MKEQVKTPDKNPNETDNLFDKESTATIIRMLIELGRREELGENNKELDSRITH